MQQGRIYPLTSLDVRVRVLLLIPVSIAAMTLYSETLLLCLFALAAVWLLMFGLHKKALAYILVYAVLWAVLFPLREMQIPGSIPLLTVYVRRIINGSRAGNGCTHRTAHSVTAPYEAPENSGAVACGIFPVYADGINGIPLHQRSSEIPRYRNICRRCAAPPFSYSRMHTCADADAHKQGRGRACRLGECPGNAA